VQRLSEVHIKSTIGGKTFHILDSLGLNQGIYNAGAKKIDFTYVTKFGKEDEVLEFSAWDASSKTPIETIFMVTLKSGDPAPAGRFIIKESILIGGQGNATSGSFYSVALGKRLTILTARSQPADVDFAYFYGATNKATIAAPANEDAQTIPYGAKTMSSWATKNRTLFFVVKGANGARPVDWYDENINKATKLTKAAQLAAGNVVVYKTATAQGAFVVTDIETGIAGAITINLIKKE
jgi:hypothetical protein